MSLRLALVSIAAASLALTSAAAHDHDGDRPGFKLVNASGRVIRRVQVSASTSPTWGPNLLEGDPLEPDEAALVRVTGRCDGRDLRLVAENRTEYLEEEVSLCAGDDEDDTIVVVTVDDRALTFEKKRRSHQRYHRHDAGCGHHRRRHDGDGRGGDHDRR